MSDSDSEYSTVSEHTITDSSAYYNSNTSSNSSIHDCPSPSTSLSEYSTIHTTPEYTSTSTSDVESTENDEDIQTEVDEDTQSEVDEDTQSEVDEVTDNVTVKCMLTISHEHRIHQYVNVATQTEREMGNNSMADSLMEESTIDPEPRGSGREWDIPSSSRDVPRTMTEAHLPPIRLECNFHTSITQNRNRQVRERDECSICYEVMLDDQLCVRLPCTHQFHGKCVAPWLSKRRTCPICRKKYKV